MVCEISDKFNAKIFILRSTMLGTRTAGISARASLRCRRRPNVREKSWVGKVLRVNCDHYQQWQQPEDFDFDYLDDQHDSEHRKNNFLFEEFLCKTLKSAPMTLNSISSTYWSSSWKFAYPICRCLSPRFPSSVRTPTSQWFRCPQSIAAKF